MTKFTLTDLIMGFLCLCIYLPFLVIGMAVFAVVEAIHAIQRNNQAQRRPGSAPPSATKGNEHE